LKLRKGRLRVRTDEVTGLVALSAREVERVGEPEGHVELWNPDQHVEIEGYVVRAADRGRVDALTGDSVPPEMLVRTRHGLLVVRRVHADLAPLFGAKVGAPFVVRYQRSGRYDVLVGEPDTAELSEEVPLSEVWKATESPNLVHSQRVAERAAAEKAQLEAALVFVRRGSARAISSEADELFPRR
jgi:hypothetical protein